MNIPFSELPPTARIWVYASNREFTEQERSQINELGANFVAQWTAHQQQLRAAFTIEQGVFLMLGVDENLNDASGCSIDKSVHFMQHLEQTFSIRLFDRMQLELLLGGNVLLVNKQKLAAMVQEGSVNEQSTVFNKMVTTKEDFDREFLIPLNKSWVYPAIVASQVG
jgi:hypothetical protein